MSAAPLPTDNNNPFSSLITQHDLDRLGIKMRDSAALLQEVNNRLYERVGLEVIGRLSDNDLDELVRRQETNDKTNDSAVLFAWLSQRVAHLDEIVSDERTLILGDLAKKADELSDAA